MSTSLSKDIERLWHQHMLNKIIMVNLAVFLVVNVIRLFMFVAGGGAVSGLYTELIHGLSLSAEPWRAVLFLWTWFTHMFLHEGIWHIAWNMLLLYWFGRILGDFIGDRRILPIYILSGLAGGMLYVISYHLLPKAGIAPYALGASAAVLGVIMATAMIAPNYEMRLLFLGNVKLKWIASFFLVLNVVAFSSVAQTGSSAGHLGGILGGFLCVRGLRGGSNWVDALADLFDRWRYGKPEKKVRSRQSSLQVVHKQSGATRKKTNKTSILSQEDRVNQLLDKIKASGYDSLTASEKEELRKASES